MSRVAVSFRFVAAAGVGYLLGSLPSGVLIGKVFGVDPRTLGSHKTGAANVLRTLGRGPAATVAAFDVGKGVAAVLVARHLLFGRLPSYADYGESVAGSAAILGHNHSIFIRFTGGRGVLTGAGAMLVISPAAWLCGFVAAVVPIALTRYVSLGSIMGAAVSPTAELVLVLTRQDSLPHFLFLAFGGGFVIYSHRDNIRRLLSGTERKLGQSAAAD